MDKFIVFHVFIFYTETEPVIKEFNVSYYLKLGNARDEVL